MQAAAKARLERQAMPLNDTRHAACILEKFAPFFLPLANLFHTAGHDAHLSTLGTVFAFVQRDNTGESSQRPLPRIRTKEGATQDGCR